MGMSILLVYNCNDTVINLSIFANTLRTHNLHLQIFDWEPVHIP